MMRYTDIPGLAVPVSDIIFGCCNPILINGDEQGIKLLDMAYSNGFTAFDTAKVYGKSEEVLGRWLKSTGLRDSIVLISKGCHPDPEPRLDVPSLKEDIESSLERLQTDHIDIYMLHRDDPDADVEGIMDTLDAYVRQGVIRKIGVSNWTHKRMEEANRIAAAKGFAGFTVSSPQMSLARQVNDPWGGGCVSVSWDEEAKSWYKNHPEIAVIVYSCLAHGMFSGKVDTKRLWRSKRSLDGAARKGYWSRENIKRLKVAEDIARTKNCPVANISIAWCRQQEFKAFPIVTVSSEKRIKENVDGIDIVLSDDEMHKLSLNI